jgi:hypothetical protein
MAGTAEFLQEAGERDSVLAFLSANERGPVQHFHQAGTQSWAAARR